ncbi:uncharacterized protein EI97DRAFT_437104 [Westerdykella ornata]|uniref:Uncharacterized protein n=1 Tax=Westerdykella ornata TaxID=318751 RepID=A0A6A6J6K9_WESOR|nr:uncharacterized protein EI97DRAFT_437104 [Westerdykella ornata]KAF2272210.1 hypothetical protein EI97DRAFT_437104 [Westerdykella ornata]
MAGFPAVGSGGAVLLLCVWHLRMIFLLNDFGSPYRLGRGGAQADYICARERRARTSLCDWIRRC